MFNIFICKSHVIDEIEEIQHQEWGNNLKQNVSEKNEKVNMPEISLESAML